MKSKKLHLFRAVNEVGIDTYYAGDTCHQALSAREPEKPDPIRIENLGTVVVVENEE